MKIEVLARKLQPLMPREVSHWLRVRELAYSGTKELIDKQIVMTAQRVLGAAWNRPLLSMPPRAIANPKGGFHLGSLLYEKEKWPVGISRQELIQNLAIFGRSGAGKTNAAFHLLRQLNEQKVPFVFLDWKRTARHLLPKLKSRVQVFTPGRRLLPFRFNPFVPPPALEPKVYAHLLVDVLSDAYTLGEGARSLIQKALVELYSDGSKWPSVKDVIQEVEKVPGTQRIQLWKTSALRALQSLALADLSAADEAGQKQIVDLLVEGQTIIELDGLNLAARQFLVPILSLWLYHTLLAQDERETLKLVLFIEEAHHVLYRGDARKESVIELLLRQGREMGLAIVVIDQHPSLISSAVLGNTFTSICLNLKNPQDVRKAADLSLVGESDREMFTKLPVGQAVVKLQDRWREPFLVQVPQVPVEKGFITDERLLSFVSRRAGSSSIKPEKQGSRGFHRVLLDDLVLSVDELAFLDDVLTRKLDGVKRRYRRLKWSIHKGHRIKEALVRRGWLASEVVPVGNSRKVLLRISEQAREKLGLSKASVRREGLAHEYWKSVYARRLREQGYRVSVESPRIGGYVDVLGERNGKRIGVEIETGKSNVVENVRNCIRAGFDQVWVVAATHEAWAKIDRRLAAAGLLGIRRLSLLNEARPFRPSVVSSRV